MHRKLHKHGRRSYLSVGRFGDSQSLLEREPLRSKDRGLYSYNIDDTDRVVPTSTSNKYIGANVVAYLAADVRC